MRTALVVMPFAGEDSPALGPELLKAGLERQGISCDLHYLNLRFAAATGLRAYRAVDRSATLLVGEWLFAEALFGERPASDEHFLRRVLASSGYPEDLVAGLPELRRAATAFIAQCAAMPWEEYDVIGFSSSFQQNCASLALASRLRETRRGGARIVLGGANCEGEMGEALLEVFPFLDAVFSGEADEALSELLTEWAAGRSGAGVPGVLTRGAASPPLALVRDMDALPIPDFRGYYRQLAESGLGLDPRATHLKIETSRGCWWGERAHCTFCGLNGQSMGFRRKSTARALEEFERLAAYPTRSVLAADNILDKDAFNDLLPKLAQQRLGLRLFYEVKSTITREQVDILARAGVRRIQGGLESMAGPVLKRMKKGVRVLDNVALMKNAADCDVALTWNLLCHFPGETRADHAGMADLLPSLFHLQPPTGIYEVQVHRFSPFHRDPAGSGIGPLRAAAAYAHVYPFDEAVLRRLAYYFDRAESGPAPPSIEPLAELVRQWRLLAAHGATACVAVDDGETVFVRDARRPEETKQWEFRGRERAALLACDQPRRPGELARVEGVGDDAIEEALRPLMDRHIVLRLDGLYLSLPHLVRIEAGEDSHHALDVAARVDAARLAALTAA